MTIHPLHKATKTLADSVIVSQRQLPRFYNSGGRRTGNMDTHLMTSEGENSWTNEKHVKYLNSMEQSFVQAMFENNINNGGRVLRLDRYVPDTSESTLDLKPQRSKKHDISGIFIIIMLFIILMLLLLLLLLSVSLHGSVPRYVVDGCIESVRLMVQYLNHEPIQTLSAVVKVKLR